MSVRFTLASIVSLSSLLAAGLITGALLEWSPYADPQWNVQSARAFAVITILTLFGLVARVRIKLGNIGVVSAAVLIPLIILLFLVPYVALWAWEAVPSSSIVFWSPATMGRTLLVGGVLFVFFCIGVALGVNHGAPSINPERRLHHGTAEDWERVAIVFSWIALVLLLFFSVAMGPALFARSYADTIYRTNEGPIFGLFLLAELFARAGIVSWALVVAISGKPIWRSKAAFIPLSVFLLFLFAQGDRGSLFITAVLMVVAHPSLWRKQALLRFVVAVLISLTVVSALRYARYSDVRTVGATVREAFESREAVGIQDALENMGGSITVLNRTVSLIEHGEPYWYGRSYLYALIRLIPTTDAASLLGAESNADVWITNRTDPNRAAAGGGLGFSFLAEVFLNWGLPIGIPLISLLGWIIGAVSRAWVLMNAQGFVLLHLLVIYAGFTMARGTVATGSRYVVYTLVIIGVVRFIQQTSLSFRSSRGAAVLRGRGIRTDRSIRGKGENGDLRLCATGTQSSRSTSVLEQ